MCLLAINKLKFKLRKEILESKFYTILFLHESPNFSNMFKEFLP